MGCASSVTIQIDDDKDNKKISANGKDVAKIKKDNEKIEEKSKENQKENYFENVNNSNDDNVDSKVFDNTKIFSNIKNIKINDKYNQSTNFKYLKEQKMNLIKSNPLYNKNENISQYKFIPLKHPLDSSLENRNSELNQLRNLNISEEKEKNNNQININKNININNSIEERINNYREDYNDDEEGVNIGNYGGDGDNDDMCNFGQSMDFDKMKKSKNNNENEIKEICIIFEIQSTGVKYNINVKENVKLIELIELFKKKIKLSSFEKPEFVFNAVFLVDFEKPISEYKIGDNSKINVFI